MKCNIREVSGNSKSTNFRIYFSYNKGLCGYLARLPALTGHSSLRSLLSARKLTLSQMVAEYRF
jgi:hypothetical protein